MISALNSRKDNCQVCGSLNQIAGICRDCAVHLVDLALPSTEDERLSDETEASFVPESDRQVVRLTYDHYQVCLTAEGLPLELGRGSMGITHKAIDANLGCPVALKIINARYLPSVSARERFLWEARTAAKLRHSNIASVFHLGLDETDCFYAMEYIQGETLESRIERDGAIPYRTALQIVAQAARALWFAHQRGFVHRDIKPTNIMLMKGDDPDNEIIVKVIDFGLVKALSGDDLRGEGENQEYFAGTPFYSSPEQLKSGVIDGRSDIYSLGKCFLYMLSGSPSSANTEFRGGGTGYRLPGGHPNRMLPPAVLALLDSMVSPDPALRPQSAGLLLDGIEQCSGHSKHRLRWLSLTALALFGIASLIVLITRAAHERTYLATVVKAHSFCVQGDEFLDRYSGEGNRRAIQLYLSALSALSGSAEARAGLAAAYFQNVAWLGAPAAQLDLAVENAQRAIALEPNSPRAFTILGSVHSFQGHHWQALADVHRALEINPRFPQAMRNFGLLWSTVGQPQLGLPWAKAAAEIEPANISAWAIAADASVDLCSDQEAEGYYRRCLAINPIWMNARWGLAHIHLLEGDFEGARKELEVAQSIESQSIFTLTLKAQIELFSGNYLDAEATYRRLLTMNHDGCVNYYSAISYLSAVGYLRVRAGDANGAIPFLEEASSRRLEESQGPQAVYDLAAIRAIQGNKKAALSLLLQAISSGWVDYRAMSLDPRFESLRGDEEFQKMQSDLSTRVSQMRIESQRLCSKPPRLADYGVGRPGEY